jgi:hypothetical protein
LRKGRSVKTQQSSVSRLAIVLAWTAVMIVGWSGRAAAWEQRRGTISVGFQAGISSLEGTAVYTRHGYETDEFEYPLSNYRFGPAMGLHFRYALDRAHAAGVTLEDIRFRRKSGVDPSMAKEFQINTVFFDYYLYLARRERLTPSIVLGLGFHRDAFRFSQSDHLIPPLALAANLGGSLEYFVRPPFSIETTLRGYYLGTHGSGEWSVDGSGSVAASLQVGFHYYVLQSAER